MDFFGYATGITSLTIIALSYFCFVIFLARYAISRRIETLLQGFALFALGSNWLGFLLAFLKVLPDDPTRAQEIMVRSWCWAPAATATVWIYLVFTLVRPKLKMAVLAFYGVLDVIYLYLMYFKTLEYSTYSPETLDSSVTGIMVWVLLFYILSALAIIGPLYLWIGFRSKRPDTQLKGKVIGVGVVLFAFFAIFDGIIQASANLLIIIRIMVLISIVLMYLGFTLPVWFRRRFLVDKLAA